jgi:hypothetical protein
MAGVFAAAATGVGIRLARGALRPVMCGRRAAEVAELAKEWCFKVAGAAMESKRR